MKVTIYVRDKHLDRLYRFIKTKESNGFIKWFHDRPGVGVYFMVTISYDDFVRLND